MVSSADVEWDVSPLATRRALVTSGLRQTAVGLARRASAPKSFPPARVSIYAYNGGRVSMFCSVFLVIPTVAVTLAVRARPMSEAVAAIAAQTHTHLGTEGPIGLDTVVLNVRQVRLSALEKKLAEVSHGKWVLRNGTRALIRDEAGWRDWRAAEMRERERGIVEAFADPYPPANLTLPGPFDPSLVRRLVAQLAASDHAKPVTPEKLANERSEEQRVWQMDPAHRAVIRAARALGRHVLAEMIDGRQAFGTAPGSHVRRLPGGEAILRQFNEEARKWGAAARRRLAIPPTDIDLLPKAIGQSR